MTELETKQAKRKWWNQKQSAKQRGIGWDFSFEDWLDFWISSGHWHQRGIKSADAYVMSRIGDQGPYHPNNVVIKTNKENVLEGNIGRNKPRPVRMSCLCCGNVVSTEARERHWASKTCKEKGLRRALVLI